MYPPSIISNNHQPFPNIVTLRGMFNKILKIGKSKYYDHSKVFCFLFPGKPFMDFNVTRQFFQQVKKDSDNIIWK